MEAGSALPSTLNQGLSAVSDCNVIGKSSSGKRSKLILSRENDDTKLANRILPLWAMTAIPVTMGHVAGEETLIDDRGHADRNRIPGGIGPRQR